MKHFLIILTIALFTACSSSADKKTEQKEIQVNVLKETTTESDNILPGERIDGPANVRDRMNGTVIATLHDNVLVETAPHQDNWYRIGLDIRLSDTQLKESKIEPGSDLISIDGQIIGKTLQTVKIWIKYENTGYFEAFTHAANINPHTIPERILENEINKGNLTFSALKSFIDNLQFTDIGKNPDLQYRQLYILETTVDDPSPRDRITLFFDNNEDLTSVVHSRELTLSGFSTYALVRGHSLTIIAKLDEKEVKKIVDDRNNFYNSVD